MPDIELPKSPLRAAPGYVVTTRPEAKEQTEGGIYIPEGVGEGKTRRVRVLSVGRGPWTSIGVVPPDVEVGDLILVTKYSGHEFTEAGQDVFVIAQNEILGKFEE